MRKVIDSIDDDLEVQNLLELLKDRDERIGLALDQQDELTRKKLEARKALLKERR